MTAFLLDVNALLALTDPMHIHHEAAHEWFTEGGRRAWATCPITENAFVRIASHPAYPNRPGDVPVVLALLRGLCATPGHQFWQDEVSLHQILQPDVLLTHTQVTDVYLLGLAVARGGKLATFDQRIAPMVVRGGAEAIELLGI